MRVCKNIPGACGRSVSNKEFAKYHRKGIHTNPSTLSGSTRKEDRKRFNEAITESNKMAEKIRVQEHKLAKRNAARWKKMSPEERRKKISEVMGIMLQEVPESVGEK